MECTIENLMSFETDSDVVVELVLQGYREINEGKGVDGDEFFEEFQRR